MRTGDSYYDYKSKADDPPNSRLFIICTKSLNEDDFKNAFSKFGNIEEVWIVRDRQTGEPKGVAYIKYSKTSEAALAMETMNGEIIADNSRPLKVMIASSKEQGSKREENEDRLLRLFIVVPKTMTEDEVRDYFKKYGDLDYVNVVKDRETRESKGIAYVRYFRMSHAARAFEECDKSFRAVFARPKESVQDRHSYPMGGGGMPISGPNIDRSSYYSSGPGDVINNYPNPDGYTRLIAIVTTSLTQNLIAQLFDIVPGMEICRFTSDGRQFSGRKVLIQYSTPQAAAYAREKFNGFEFPPGCNIIVKPDLDCSSSGYGGSYPKSDHYMGSGEYHRPSRETKKGDDSEVPNGIMALTKALAEATQIIQKAGLLPSSHGLLPTPANSSKDSDPDYCSVALPPPQPLSPAETKAVERLFIVCQPAPPPVHALWDVFCRFGNLIDVYILNGKNCGYVCYSNKESADTAVETLHGREICRMRIKVMLAEPKKAGDSSRKRLRTDLDN